MDKEILVRIFRKDTIVGLDDFELEIENTVNKIVAAGYKIVSTIPVPVDSRNQFGVLYTFQKIKG